MILNLLLLKIIPLAFGVFIAYLISRIGKYRVIGVKWSFLLALLMPILAIIITLFSKMKGKLQKRTTVIVKILAIVLALYGGFMILGGISTQPNNRVDANPDSAYNKFVKKHGTVNTGFKEVDYWLNQSSISFGRIVSGGILTVFLNNDDFIKKNWKSRKYSRIHGGILLISIGLFLLRRKKIKQSLTNQ